MNQEHKLFCYEVEPLDFGWEHMQPIEKVVMEIFNDEEESNGEILKDMQGDWIYAQRMAGAQGCGAWRKGRESPSIFWIPTKEGHMAYGFIFKQDHSGVTFIVSPVEMPWLEDDTSS